MSWFDGHLRRYTDQLIADMGFHTKVNTPEPSPFKAYLEFLNFQAESGRRHHELMIETNRRIRQMEDEHMKDLIRDVIREELDKRGLKS